MLGITVLAVKMENNEGSTVDPARGVGQGFFQALGRCRDSVSQSGSPASSVEGGQTRHTCMACEVFQRRDAWLRLDKAAAWSPSDKGL